MSEYRGVLSGAKVLIGVLVLIAIMIFAVRAIGEEPAEAPCVYDTPDAEITCVVPPAPRYDDPCAPDLVIVYDHHNTTKSRMFWSNGRVEVADGQVFFQRKENKHWYSYPVARTEIHWDKGWCHECE